MQVTILPFGILKDTLGPATFPLELPAGATVSALLRHLAALHPHAHLHGIAVGVRAEYATPDRILAEGDEVALLPPVSGGAPDSIHVALVREPIDAAALAAAARAGSDGAVIVFDGIVRNNTRGRRTLHLDYEAYEEMALRQMNALAIDALARFAIRHVTLVHRLGRLHVGETSVLIVVASAHRAPAYEASRWLIDTLKQTVPIWKRETFVDGVVWAPGEPFPAELAVQPPAHTQVEPHEN